MHQVNKHNQFSNQLLLLQWGISKSTRSLCFEDLADGKVKTV